MGGPKESPQQKGDAENQWAVTSQAASEETPLLPDATSGLSSASHHFKRLASNVYGAVSSPETTMRLASDRIFQRQRNSRFAEHAELAFRCGFYVALLTLPGRFGIGENIGLNHFIQESRVRSSAAIVQFVYTIYKTQGDTVSFIWAGLAGNSLGSVLPFFLWFLFPDGVGTKDPFEDPAFVAGGFIGSIFVILVLWLNLGVLAKIFALSTFVWHWMAFLKPGAAGIGVYKGGFSLAWDGPMVQMMIPAFSGSAISLACTSIPYGVLATDKACMSARKIIVITGRTWIACMHFFCASKSNSFDLARVENYMSDMNEEMTRLKGHIDTAWWECFGLTKRHRRLHMLQRLNSVIYETCERLTSIVMACELEDFKASHESVMSRVKPSLEHAVTQAHQLLTRCTEVACEGDALSSDTKEDVACDCRDLRSSLDQLAKDFRSAKAGVGFREMSQELLSEHAFCFAASNYANIAIKYGEFLCDPEFDDPARDPHRFVKAITHGTYEIFSPEALLDKSHLNWTTKNSASVLACFWIGCFGYSRLILKYEADIACTAAILLSKFSGSAMKKNLSRLQGVVLGLVTGALGFALLGRCEFIFQLGLTLFLWAWLSSTLFFYFDSPTYGGITCLMALFGAQQFIKPCSDEVADPSKGFYMVINVVVSILVMTIVDSIFSMGRPSSMAHQAMVDAWENLLQAVSGVMDPLHEEVAHHGKHIRSAIATAEYLGTEASDEPRYWRTPWKTETMTAAVECARNVRVHLTNLEFSVSMHSSAAGKEVDRDPLFQKVMMMPGFMELRRLNLQALKRTRKLLDIMIHDVDSQFPYLETADGQENIFSETEVAVASLIETINEEFDSEQNQGDLTHDPAARVSIVFMSILGMTLSMRGFVQACIRGG